MGSRKEGCGDEAVLHGGTRSGGGAAPKNVWDQGWGGVSLLSKNMGRKRPRSAAPGRVRAALFFADPRLVLNVTPPLAAPTLHISFRFVEGEGAAADLDMLGSPAPGLRLHLGSLEGSPICWRWGRPTDSHGALRFSLGYGNTDDDGLRGGAIETVSTSCGRCRRSITPGRRICSISKIGNDYSASEGGAPFVARRAMNLHGWRFTSLRPPSYGGPHSFIKLR